MQAAGIDPGPLQLPELDPCAIKSASYQNGKRQDLEETATEQEAEKVT
jgi:hypothetical protein